MTSTTKVIEDKEPGVAVGVGAMKAALTANENFEATDFTSRDSIAQLFPACFRERYELRKKGQKILSNAVNIEAYRMKTPFGDQVLINGSDLILEPNKRQVLFGANSTGKTLLFHNISEGKIKEFPKHVHVHHCKELENHELGDTVLNTVIKSNPFRNILQKIEARIKSMLSATDDKAPTAAVKTGLQDTRDFIELQLRSIRSHDADERAGKMLRVLGFDESGMAKPCVALSGGLRMRVALCMAFFIEADLLLLDEPTNHLDFPSVLWLENRLRGYGSGSGGSFLLVSHDRELLNNVCMGVLLLEDKQIKYYNIGFKEFEKKKAAEDKKTYDDIEKFLQKNRNADPSSQLGRQKQDKKDWSEKYHQRQVALAGKFTFPASTVLTLRDGETPETVALIDLVKVRFSYDVKTGVYIFNDPIDFKVMPTTRCGVMGPNGAGKSTLLKLLTGKLIPSEGTVTSHPAYKLAYFGQHSTAELNLELTAAEFMAEQFPAEKIGQLRQHLAKTSIVGMVADTRMQRLSFSQRSCIIFAKLTYVCPHLLIMDEPTNFLDLESVDALIAACNKYKGALLLVSHNRDFLKKCATTYLSVVPGKFDLYDNLKKAEQSTYTFIADMESGIKVSKDALSKNPGGGTVHHSQVKQGEQKTEEKNADGSAKVVAASASGAKPAAAATTVKKVAPAAAAAPAKALTYAVNEVCQALWTDGKFYPALIKKVEPLGKYSIVYTQYNEKAIVPAASLKKAAAAAPAKKA